MSLNVKSCVYSEYVTWYESVPGTLSDSITYTTGYYLSCLFALAVVYSTITKLQYASRVIELDCWNCKKQLINLRSLDRITALSFEEIGPNQTTPSWMLCLEEEIGPNQTIRSKGPLSIIFRMYLFYHIRHCPSQCTYELWLRGDFENWSALLTGKNLS